MLRWIIISRAGTSPRCHCRSSRESTERVLRSWLVGRTSQTKVDLPVLREETGTRVESSWR